MQPRNRGSELLTNRLRPLATTLAKWSPKKILHGLTGTAVHDTVGEQKPDSRTATGLAPPGPTDNALAWCALWGSPNSLPPTDPDAAHVPLVINARPKQKPCICPSGTARGRSHARAHSHQPSPAHVRSPGGVRNRLRQRPTLAARLTAHPNRGCRSWGLKPPVSSRLRAM